MSDNPTPEKKIIVDEDWKTQVEAEKEALRQKPEDEAQPAMPEDESAGSLPPPTLTFLAGSLYLQAAIALGLLPNPMTDKAEVSLVQAQHTIDLVAMLQEKTEGNRTPEESEELEAILHQLRLAYIEVQSRR